jgi:hypothetical protein
MSGLTIAETYEAIHDFEEAIKNEGFQLTPGVKWQYPPIPARYLPPDPPPSAGQHGSGGGGDPSGGGSAPSGLLGSGGRTVGYYNVDPHSGFFRDLMNRYPGAQVLPQERYYGNSHEPGLIVRPF